MPLKFPNKEWNGLEGGLGKHFKAFRKEKQKKKKIERIKTNPDYKIKGIMVTEMMAYCSGLERVEKIKTEKREEIWRKGKTSRVNQLPSSNS